MLSIRSNPPNEDWALSNAYWVIALSNGQIFYQNDDELEPQGKSAWGELKKYLDETKLRISRILLKFRSNEIHFQINDDVQYIYMSKGLGKEWTSDVEDSFFVVGIQSTPTVIQKYWYKKPELTLFKKTADELDSPSVKPEFLHFMG